jgi:hypothetical protein
MHEVSRRVADKPTTFDLRHSAVFFVEALTQASPEKPDMRA